MEIYGQPFTEGKTAEQDLGYIDIASVEAVIRKASVCVNACALRMRHNTD